MSHRHIGIYEVFITKLVYSNNVRVKIEKIHMGTRLVKGKFAVDLVEF